MTNPTGATTNPTGETTKVEPDDAPSTWRVGGRIATAILLGVLVTVTVRTYLALRSPTEGRQGEAA